MWEVDNTTRVQYEGRTAESWPEPRSGEVHDESGRARIRGVCIVLPTCNQLINNFLFVSCFVSLFSSLFRRLGRAFVAGAVVHYSVGGDFLT